MTSPLDPVATDHAATRTFDTLSRGNVLPAVDLVVSAADVRAYLEATGETHDRWGDRVPPVMLSALMLATLLAQVEIPKGIMHTGHEHESMRAARVGEALRVTVRVTSHSVRRGALMASFDTEARPTDDGDEVIAVSRASVLVPPLEGTTEGNAE